MPARVAGGAGEVPTARRIGPLSVRQALEKREDTAKWQIEYFGAVASAR